MGPVTFRAGNRPDALYPEAPARPIQSEVQLVRYIVCPALSLTPLSAISRSWRMIYGGLLTPSSSSFAMARFASRPTRSGMIKKGPAFDHLHSWRLIVRVIKPLHKRSMSICRPAAGTERDIVALLGRGARRRRHRPRRVLRRPAAAARLVALGIVPNGGRLGKRALRGRLAEKGLAERDPHRRTDARARRRRRRR